MNCSARRPSSPGATRCPCIASRWPIQFGSCARSTGSIFSATPPFCSAVNHADFCVAASRRGSVTSISASGLSAAASAFSASAPSLPGLPDGMRSSISWRSPNSDIACVAPSSTLQSKPRSTVCTERSVKPAARAAARMRSHASCASSGSSP